MARHGAANEVVLRDLGLSDGEAALLLECAHRTVEVLVEPVAVRLLDELESGQTRSNLRDSVAAIPSLVRGRLGAYVGHAAS